MIGHIFGCAVKDVDDDEAIYISDTQFNFHQNENKLYVSTKVLPEADGRILDKVVVEWRGIDQGNSPDSLTLEDGGVNGDIIAGDDYYTLNT